MAKTFKLRRTGRSAMKYRKRRTTRTLLTRTPYAAKPGLNVGASSRFFAPLPYKMNLRSDWMVDTRYRCGLGGGVAKVPRTECLYWFIDPLNPTINVNNDNTLTAGQRYFMCASMAGMLSLYQEAVIRNSVMNVEVTCDYQKVIADNALQTNYDSASEPTIHFACAQVPLSYLRDNTNTLHTAANAGGLYSGVDYYSSLTQTQRAKSTTLAWGSSPGEPYRTRLTADGYSHNGVQQTITSYTTWDPPATSPTVIYAYPNPGQRNVFLFAVRIRYTPLLNVDQFVEMRVAYNLQQHLIFQDRTPDFPYVRGLGNAA